LSEILHSALTNTAFADAGVTPSLPKGRGSPGESARGSLLGWQAARYEGLLGWWLRNITETCLDLR